MASKLLLAANWLLGEDVSSSALMLHVRVGLPLNNLLDLESRCKQGVRDLLGAEEQEIHRHALSPPFVEMDRLIANVEREKQ